MGHRCIFDYLVGTLQSNLIHFLRLHHISNQSQETKELTTDERNMEVNRLLGWAVAKLKHHYERKHYAKTHSKTEKSMDTILDADTAAEIAKYLGNMKILHHEAIANKTYMALYYDSSTLILNNGGLSLISAQYFPFGYILLRSVRKGFTEEFLELHGNDSVKMAFDDLIAQDSIRKVFDGCDKNEPNSLDDSFKGMIFTELVRKVFHARVNEVIKKYRDQHFGRHSKKGDGGTTFRGFLRARTKKATEKK